MAEIALDKLLYRLLCGAPGGFRFRPGPVAWDEVTIPNPVSIYVHIPFCRSLCPFCPYTKTLYGASLAADYSRALEVEARRVLANLDGKKISSVYFGGGTPLTVLESLESVLAFTRRYLTPGADVAVEVHPHDIGPSTVERLALAGVSMVSLGVESLDNDVLAGLGRNHSAEDAFLALRTLMNYGRFSLNADLITAIPGQRLESAVLDMLMLMEEGVDQVAAYPLMDFRFTRMKTHLSLIGQFRLLRDMASAAEKAGYLRTSVWTWTKPGSPKYSSITREDYVGIGAGAATHLGRDFWVNTFDVGAYVDTLNGARPESLVALSIRMDDRQSALYRLFWRCYEGKFDLDSPEARAIPVLRPLLNVAGVLGLAARSSSTVRLTERGFFMYHLLERYYTRRYIGRLWHHCRQSAFPEGIVL